MPETPEKTSMALQTHQSALYELDSVHPQTFEKMSLLIFTHWPSCVRSCVLEPMHQELSAVTEAICVYFPLGAAPSSLCLSLHQGYTLHYMYLFNYEYI